MNYLVMIRMIYIESLIELQEILIVELLLLILLGLYRFEDPLLCNSILQMSREQLEHELGK